MRRALLSSAIMFVLAPAAVLAAEAPAGRPIYSASETIDVEGSQCPTGKVIQVHDGPVFLGCVYSYHECEHLGHRRGFYNHFTRHDHRTCHRGPSYACYGQ